MRIFIALNNARIASGRFLKGAGLVIWGLVFTVMAAFFFAVMIDMAAASYWGIGKSFGLSSLFFSQTYSRNETGLEGIAAICLIGIAVGAVLRGIGYLFAIGHNDDEFY